MITSGQIKLYDGKSGESVYTLGNYGLGWLVARVSDREQIVIESISNVGITTLVDFGFNWERIERMEL